MAHSLSLFHCLLTLDAEMHRERQIVMCWMACSPRDSSQMQRAQMHREIQTTGELLTVFLGPEGSELEGEGTSRTSTSSRGLGGDRPAEVIRGV
mmetsp:Transcript_151351/g.367647  ORF Transcript_151351/g.367647 Transcript_151351/m.367647 type:complete len:94 (+) Transcript_151351:28-309(+)